MKWDSALLENWSDSVAAGGLNTVINSRKRLSVALCVLGGAVTGAAMPLQQMKLSDRLALRGAATQNFLSQQRAQEALERVMEVTGLPQNFDLRADPQVGNAQATVELIRNAAGEVVGFDRLISYNQAFMESVRDRTRTDWSQIAILAHEVGHHLCNHVLQGDDDPEDELEADKFAGHVLGRMQATLDQALSMTQIFSVQGSTTHPGRSRRQAAVEEGWREAQDQMMAGTVADSAVERATEAAARADSLRRAAEDAAAGSDAATASLRAEAEQERERADSLRRVADTAVAKADSLRNIPIPIAQAGPGIWLILVANMVMLPVILVLALRKPRQIVIREVRRASSSILDRSRSIASGRWRRDIRIDPPPPRPPRPDVEGRPLLRLVDVRPVTGLWGIHIVLSSADLRDVDGGVVLGRHELLVDHVLRHDTVSGRHARLSRAGSDILVEDLNSTNGTRVNERRLTPFEPQEIAPGDVVQMGNAPALSVRPG